LQMTKRTMDMLYVRGGGYSRIWTRTYLFS
jgi:hypothetical protein